jgi:hypothetical protein
MLLASSAYAPAANVAATIAAIAIVVFVIVSPLVEILL